MTMSQFGWVYPSRYLTWEAIDNCESSTFPLTIYRFVPAEVVLIDSAILQFSIERLRSFPGITKGGTTQLAEYASDENTLLLWHCNEAAGATVNDASGNANSGTWAGTAQWNTTTKKFGASSAGSFSHTNYIAFDKAILSGLTIGTFECWLYADNITADNSIIWVEGSNIRIRINANGNVNYQISSLVVDSAGTIPADTWTHFAVTWNGTNVVSYLNGVLDTSTASAQTPSTASIPRIGDDPFRNPWDGYIDEVRISNIARTNFGFQFTTCEQTYNSPSISIKINGTDRTTALGGPWTSNQNNIDIADYLEIGEWNTIELIPNQLLKLNVSVIATVVV